MPSSGSSFENVWDALEDNLAQAQTIKLRSSLMIALEKHIQRQGWTQTEVASRLGVSQPRLSDLLRGKINRFALDTLVNMAVAAGVHVELQVMEAA